MPKVTLYTYWRSSSSFRVRFALSVKNIAYESVAINLLEGEHKRQEHLERSPSGYVPCLFIDGKAVVESVAIIELLEELYPSPALYPREPFARAQVRALVEVVNSGTQPLQNLHVLEHVSSDPGLRKAWAQRYIGRGLTALEGMMASHERQGVEGRYAYGDTLTAADLFVVPQLYNAQRYGVDLTPYPRVSAAAEAALLSEAAQAALPERQPDYRG